MWGWAEEEAVLTNGTQCVVRVRGIDGVESVCRQESAGRKVLGWPCCEACFDEMRL